MSKRYAKELKLTVVLKKINGESVTKLVREYGTSGKSVLYNELSNIEEVM